MCVKSNRSWSDQTHGATRSRMCKRAAWVVGISVAVLCSTLVTFRQRPNSIIEYLEAHQSCDIPAAWTADVAAPSDRLGPLLRSDLDAALRHRDVNVRRGAVAVASLHPELAADLADALAALLDDWPRLMNCDCVPCAAPIATGMLLDLGPIAVQPLVRALDESRDVSARKAAALVLGGLGDAAHDAIPALERARGSDRDVCVRQAATFALAAIADSRNGSLTLQPINLGDCGDTRGPRQLDGWNSDSTRTARSWIDAQLDGARRGYIGTAFQPIVGNARTFTIQVD